MDDKKLKAHDLGTEIKALIEKYKVDSAVYAFTFGMVDEGDGQKKGHACAGVEGRLDEVFQLMGNLIVGMSDNDMVKAVKYTKLFNEFMAEYLASKLVKGDLKKWTTKK